MFEVCLNFYIFRGKFVVLGKMNILVNVFDKQKMEVAFCDGFMGGTEKLLL